MASQKSQTLIKPPKPALKEMSALKTRVFSFPTHMRWLLLNSGVALMLTIDCVIWQCYIAKWCLCQLVFDWDERMEYDFDTLEMLLTEDHAQLCTIGQYIELGLLCAVSFNILALGLRLSSICWSDVRVKLTDTQRRLLSIPNSLLYRFLNHATPTAKPPPTPAASKPIAQQQQPLTPAANSSSLDWLFHINAASSAHQYNTPVHPNRTAQQGLSPLSEYSPDQWSPISADQSSLSLSGRFGDLSFASSNDVSGLDLSTVSPPGTFQHTVARLHTAECGSPYSKQQHISSQQELREYLQNFNKSHRTSPAYHTTRTAGSMMFQNTMSGVGTPGKYQIATMPPSEDGMEASDRRGMMSRLNASFDRNAFLQTAIAQSSTAQTGDNKNMSMSTTDAATSYLTHLNEQEKKGGSLRLKVPTRTGETRRSLSETPSTSSASVRPKVVTPVKHTLTNAVLQKFDLDPDKIELCEQNLRSWIKQTILKHLVMRIDKLNQILDSQSRQDLRLGQASIASLRHYTLMHAQDSSRACAFIHQLLPYLEISTHQAYVVKRIRDLASDACMREYKWQSGGSEPVSAGSACVRPWASHLPSDAQLVSHLLCVYLDSQLAPNALANDGKPFTGPHFLVAPAPATELHKTDGAYYVYQMSDAQPHYQLVVNSGQDVYDTGAGRHNLWYTWLMLIQHIRLEADSRVGGVLISEHGLNMTTIVDSV